MLILLSLGTLPSLEQMAVELLALRFEVCWILTALLRFGACWTSAPHRRLQPLIRLLQGVRKPRLQRQTTERRWQTTNNTGVYLTPRRAQRISVLERQVSDPPHSTNFLDTFKVILEDLLFPNEIHKPEKR